MVFVISIAAVLPSPKVKTVVEVVRRLISGVVLGGIVVVGVVVVVVGDAGVVAAVAVVVAVAAVAGVDETGAMVVID